MKKERNRQQHKKCGDFSQTISDLSKQGEEYQIYRNGAHGRWACLNSGNADHDKVQYVIHQHQQHDQADRCYGGMFTTDPSKSRHDIDTVGERRGSHQQDCWNRYKAWHPNAPIFTG